jgi:pyruvate/2-oxoglutarate dehydrogenase complex dihydrolipoamide acyltransferase (E2) component
MGRLNLQRETTENEQVSGEVRDVVMPDLQGAEEITVGAWNKKKGERVAEGETIMEAHTDKVNAEIPSPVSGVVEELLLDEGDPVKPGQAIARVTVG